MIRCILAGLLGLALMAAPEVLGYEGEAASLHYVIGPLIVSFSVIAVWEAVRGVRYANVPLTLVLTVLTPVFTVDAGANMVALVVGPGVALLSLMPNRISGSYGGGWSTLFGRSSVARSPNEEWRA